MILNNGKLILLISFVLSAMLIYRLLKRRKKKIISWKTLTYSGHVFFLGVIIYIVYTLTYYSVVNHYSQKQFSAKDWIDFPEKRYELYKDIQRSKVLIDKDKNRVNELLGAPSFNNDSTYYYYMGIKPGLFIINPEYLIINFDGDTSRQVSSKHYS